MTHMTLSSEEKPLFQKRIPLWHLFYSVRTFAHTTTLLLKILGGRMHGPSPTSNFGGPSPKFPHRSPSLLLMTMNLVPVGLHFPNSRACINDAVMQKMCSDEYRMRGKVKNRCIQCWRLKRKVIRISEGWKGKLREKQGVLLWNVGKSSVNTAIWDRWLKKGHQNFLEIKGKIFWGV